MAWLYLVLAGISEIGWPIGFKMASLAQKTSGHVFWITFAVVMMGLSGLLLYLAQREIPIGTAYIIWTGIGGISTFLIGIWFFGDASSTMRYFGALLVLVRLGVLRFF